MIAIALVAAVTAACSPDERAASASTTATDVVPTTTSAAGPSTSDGGSDPPVTDATVPTTTSPSNPSVAVPRFVDETGFDDRTVPAVASVDELAALSRPGVGGQAAVKFVIPEFDRASDSVGLARVHLMDSNFYELHDEWYAFRLLNGRPIPGESDAPVDGPRFDTIDAIYRWATAQPPARLPLGLRFIDDRLYAERFYDLALRSEPRSLGVGTLIRFLDPEAGRPDHWLIELEFSDEVTPASVARVFERLAPALPVEVADRLEWVVRSPQQEEVAQLMVGQQLPFHDRIVRYRDLVAEGTVGVYSEGISAGRLLYVGPGGADLGDATATDIVVTERVPDWLPQAAGLVTSDPQTPLAHVNLLARNRGIPNASQAGIHDDAGLRQAARVRAHAIVVARGDRLQIALITREQYAAWVDAAKPEPVSVAAIDASSLPYVVDLVDVVDDLAIGGVTQAEVESWIPALGGKSAGFLTLLSTPGITPPPDPVAITVRPYVEHVAPMLPLLEAVLADESFAESARARWLVLEGDDDVADLFPSDADARFASSYLAAHPPGTPVGDVLAAGGIREMIEDTPIDTGTLDAIVAVLADVYDDHADTTGLRFRSSSSVEDIDGFNGAGLYTSYTGFLDAAAQPDPDDRNNTVERAILRAWASYWSFEAFEERRAAGIDHLSGAMGLTVHARFDDDLEVDNGVATFTFVRGGAADDAVLEVNVQAGSVEVTNPDPDRPSTPEVITVRRAAGEITIERGSPSSLVADGDVVLDDAAVRELFAQASAVADVWRTRLNAWLPEAQHLQTVVLDLEFKTMARGWPGLDPGLAPYEGRLVLRQVRSLDPGVRRLPEAARSLPVPLDVLMRASEIAAGSCTGASGRTYDGIVVYTDPLLAPDLGFSEVPWQLGDELPVGSACEATRVDVARYASPDRALLALVDGGDAVLVVGTPTP